MQLKIDEEFQGFLRPLLDDELKLLKESITKHGIKEPIKYWIDGDGDWLIIDGHNRYSIAMDLGIDFPTEEMDFDSRVEAMTWILRQQLGRRNLNHQDRIFAVNRLKHLNGDYLNDDLPRPPMKSKEIKEKLNMHDISERQVQRIAAASDQLNEIPYSARQKLEKGQIDFNESSLRKLKSLPEEDKLQVYDILEHSDGFGAAETLNEVIHLVTGHAKKENTKEYDDVIKRILGVVAIANRKKEKDGDCGEHEKMVAFLEAAMQEWETWHAA